MYPLRAARTDANQQPIIDALRAVGAKVYYIKIPFDLLVIFRGTVELLEVKTSEGALNKKQKETVREMSYAGYWPHVVRSPDDALKAIGAT